MDQVIRVRSEIQLWLNHILLIPGMKENKTVSVFLCYGANMLAPQYTCVRWFQFVPSPFFSNIEKSHAASGRSDMIQNVKHVYHHNGEEELDMDEMFALSGEQEEGEEETNQDEAGVHVDDNEEDYFSAAERYQPKEEAVSREDVMDFENNADDVEMIDDVGSLAQSLGMSHLGRSIQLQAERAGGGPTNRLNENVPPQQGLNIGNMAGSRNNQLQGTGGIGNAIRNASAEIKVEGISDSFCQKRPISAPKLDSFNMIKVVGKGSFGKLFTNTHSHIYAILYPIVDKY